PIETECSESLPLNRLPFTPTPMVGAAVGNRVRALKRHVPPNIGRRRVRCETDLGRNVHGETVRTEPLRIQLLGLLPAILKPCGPSCAQPFLNDTVTALASEELRETPAVLLENASRAHELAERLLRRFGTRIRIDAAGTE